MSNDSPDVEVAGWEDLFGLSEVVRVQLKPWMTEKNFVLVDSVAQLAEIVDAAIAAGTCALDLETTGLDNRIWPETVQRPKGRTVDQIVGFCLSYDGETGYYVPVGHDNKEHNIEWTGSINEIRRLCENTVTVYHNASFDHEFLYGVGIDIVKSEMFEDTLILDYLRDSSDKRHGLKKLSSDYLQMEMIEIDELFAEKEKDRDFSKLDPHQEGVVHYAASDAICTYLLLQFYKTHAYRPKPKSGAKGESTFHVVPETDPKRTIYGEQSLTYKVEKMCVPAIRWMERNRPKIDLLYLERVRAQVHGLMEDVKIGIAEGFQQHGVTFTPEDVSSAQRLGKALEELHATWRPSGGSGRMGKLWDLQKTENTQQVQTDEAAMDALVAKVGDQLPFLKLVSTFRKLQKVDGTYLKPLQENTDGYPPSRETNKYHKLQDSSIRFSFQANRVDTGRFAASKGRPEFGYSGINVQSMPAGYNVGKFSARKIISRPPGEGDTSVPIFENLRSAIEDGQGFLIWIYDGHFVSDPLKDQEYCVRASCDGCPFVDQCQREEVPLDDDGNPTRNTKILSLDASARPAIIARDGYVITAIDQSGVELRVAAAISQEPKWIDEFFQCSSCGAKFPGPTLVSPPDTPIPLRKWRIDTHPPAFCTHCGSDKLGDLHTLTTKIVYGEDVADRPDFKRYRQNSKCVVGSTLVQTDRGIIPIKDLDPGSGPDQFVDLPKPIKVWTDDGIREATQFYNGGVQDTVRIRTKTRFTLEGTKTHRIRCYTEADGYCWRHMGDLREGDYVVLDRGNPLHGDVPSYGLLNPFYSKIKSATENSPVIPLTRDWCYFLGIVTGDGTCGQSSVGVAYDGREKQWEQTMCGLLNRLGLKYSIDSHRERTGQGDGRNLRVSSRRLSRVLKSWGMKDSSITAEIPSVVWQTGVEGQLSFLRGYFDTDGHVDPDGAIAATSGSYRLLEEIQILLASVGIFSQIRKSHSNHPYNGKDYYGIAITGGEAVRYAEKIGFGMTRKFERLRYSGDSSYARLPFPRRSIPDKCPIALGSKRNYGGLTYAAIDKFRPVIDFPEETLRLRDREVRIVPIEEISFGRAPVFDLVVPGPESFWANGFINHNSANFAILYGGGPSAVARATGVHKNEGKLIRDKFLAGLPRLNAWFKEVSQRANSKYEVTTGFGRKIRLPDISHSESWIQSKAERNAVNSIIQGTATGDLTKFSMGMIFKWLHENDRLDDARLLLSIHDELVFEVKKTAMDELFPVIVSKMTEWAERAGWPVPLRCDIEFGQNFQVAYDWGQIHTVNPETGRAFDPVPRFLWNQIEMHPGMWYVDDQGKEVVIPLPEKPVVEVLEEDVVDIEDPPTPVPTPVPTHVMEEEPESPSEKTPEPKSDLREGFLQHRKPKPKNPSITGPVFHFQLIPGGGNPGILDNEDATLINFFYRRLFNILDFLANEGDSAYVLKVTDSRGYSLIDITDRRMVDPDKFMFLARFSGIIGVEVE